jgi:hypothetical protein
MKIKLQVIAAPRRAAFFIQLDMMYYSAPALGSPRSSSKLRSGSVVAFRDMHSNFLPIQASFITSSSSSTLSSILSTHIHGLPTISLNALATSCCWSFAAFFEVDCQWMIRSTRYHRVIWNELRQPFLFKPHTTFRRAQGPHPPSFPRTSIASFRRNHSVHLSHEV